MGSPMMDERASGQEDSIEFNEPVNKLSPNSNEAEILATSSSNYEHALIDFDVMR